MLQLVVKRILPASLLLMLCPLALAIDTNRPEVQHFIEQMMEKHSFDREALESVLANAKSQQSRPKSYPQSHPPQSESIQHLQQLEQFNQFQQLQQLQQFQSKPPLQQL